jgi:hypothetical protein
MDKQHLPASIIHPAWAGWQYEVPSEEDSVSLLGSARGALQEGAPEDRLIAEFRVNSGDEAAVRVSEAVAMAELEAYAEQKRGVLVTRHDFDLFSVALSSMVPFGLTVEQDATLHLKRRPAHEGSSRHATSFLN